MTLVKWMALLDNEDLIYTSNNLAEKIKAIQDNKSTLRIDIPERKNTRRSLSPIVPVQTIILAGAAGYHTNCTSKRGTSLQERRGPK